MTDARDSASSVDRLPTTDTVWNPFKPDANQEALLQVLGKIDPTGQLYGMYQSAVMLLGQVSVPDRLPLAGHALRELMEKLPAYEDLLLTGEFPNRRSNVLSKVQSLRTIWVKMKRNGRLKRAAEEGVWSIPESSYQALDRFFDSHELRGKKERTSRDLALLDPMGSGLPEVVEQGLIARWMDTHDYFSGVAHHENRNTDVAEFLDRLSWLDDFLLSRLKPRTFEDHGILDHLIAEAEQG
jgi:hypothetical protein